MITKVMQVFYGADCLPYKDYERVVHYPIVGNSFQNSSNTNQINFYFDQIGGTDTTWVVVIKLPNGKIGCKLLETSSDEFGNYAYFLVDQFTTQYVGNAFLSLQGYQGNIELEYDDDTGLYSLPSSTPIIQTTGSIKLGIEYSTGIIGSDDFDTITLQTILAYLSTKLNINDGIVVQANISTADLSGFDNEQVFYDLTSKAYYQLNDGDYELYDLCGILASDKTLPKYTFSASFNPTVDELRQINEVCLIDYYGDLFYCQFEVGSYRIIRLYDLVSFYTTNPDLEFVNLINDTYKDELIHDANLDTKVFPFFNVITMTSGSKTLTGREITLIENNPNTKIYYNGVYYDRDRKNTSDQPVFINYDFSTNSNGVITITTRAVIYNSSTHVLSAGSTQISTYNKSATDTLLNLKADKSTTYTKTQVDNFLAAIQENDYVVVNTTTYPTLADFLASTGEKGNLYLYPVDTNDLTKGYSQYVWENNAWLYLGDTITNLSNYYTKLQTDTLLNAKANQSTTYTKTETDNLLNTKADKSTTYTKSETDTLLNAKANDSDVVKLTGAQTIAGTKTFKAPLKIENSAGTHNYSFNIVAADVLQLRYDSTRVLSYQSELSRIWAHKNFVPNPTNTLTLGDSDSYWKDLYLKGDIKDGTNSVSLQDFVDWQTETNQKLAELTEAVLQESVLSYTFLQWSAIPNGISTYPILFSANMDMTNVKGNSAVVNQLFQNGNFANTDNWVGQYGSLSASSNVLTYTPSAENSAARVEQNRTFISGHKYFLSCYIETTNEGQNFRFTYGTNNIGINDNTSANTKTLFQKIFTVNSNETIFRMYCASLPLGQTCSWEQVQLFDLTTMGLDSLTTVDEVRSALLSRGINIDEYNAYNEGSLKSSKPTGLKILDSDNQVKETYSLTLPILRGVGTAQDDVSKVRVGTKENQSGAVGDTISFSDMKSNTANITCDKGVVSEIGTLSGTTLTLTQAISDATFYYELATPTDQTPITLPENIDIEKGDSIEITYDNTDNVASDFDFAVITSKIKES